MNSRLTTNIKKELSNSQISLVARAIEWSKLVHRNSKVKKYGNLIRGKSCEERKICGRRKHERPQEVPP